MATAPQVSLEEYLNTEYEPDCEYIDGVLEDRNVGKRKHSKTQTVLTGWLLAQLTDNGYDVLVEQRVRISPSRFRIPDICLVSKDQTDEIIQRPPALWIEIRSPEDRWTQMHAKLRDLLNFGVPTVWVIDPYSRQAWMATQQGTVQVHDGILRCPNPTLELSLEAVLPND